MIIRDTGDLHRNAPSQNHDNVLIIIGAAISLIAIAIAVVPVHEVNAKQCNSNGGNNNDNNDQSNNSNDDGKSCNNNNNNQQVSKHNNHDSTTEGRTTPFVLSMPFP